MEGLIRGLMDVTLGGGGAAGDSDGSGRDGRRSHHRNGGEEAEVPGERQERSRSSWAEVVASGEQENVGESAAHEGQQPHEYTPPAPHQYQYHQQQQEQQQRYEPRPSAWGRPGASSAGWDAGAGGDGCGGRSEGDWETVNDHRKKHRQPRPLAKVEMSQWNGYKRPPSEQEYTPHVDGRVDVEPTQDELHDLSKACSRLWELDLNRLVPGMDYEIDCGDGKKAYQKEDMASASLFSWLSDDVFRRPTYSRFCSLLDNYNPSQGCKEVVTSQEKHEQAAFIEEISRTAPIRYLYKCLVSKGVAPREYEEFKRMLTSLWFDLYGRGGVSASSSAFEHVFVGEIKERGESEVSGFHNWIQFYLEEAKGRVDYHGYIFPRRRENPDSETQLLTIQFEWNGVLKSISSTLVGVSPEFEVALYTLCFYLGGEDNHVSLGPYPVNIKCYRHGNDKIGSVFPIAEY